MKYIMAACIIAVLSGCYQSVNQWDIERAARHCNGFENIAEIKSHFQGDEVLTCKSGKIKVLDRQNEL